MKCRLCKQKLGRRNHTSRKNTTTNLCFNCMRNPPLEERCKGTTIKNVRCKLIKRNNMDYCKVHSNQQKNQIQINKIIKGENKNENKIYNTDSR